MMGGPMMGGLYRQQKPMMQQKPAAFQASPIALAIITIVTIFSSSSSSPSPLRHHVHTALHAALTQVEEVFEEEQAIEEPLQQDQPLVLYALHLITYYHIW